MLLPFYFSHWRYIIRKLTHLILLCSGLLWGFVVAFMLFNINGKVPTTLLISSLLSYFCLIIQHYTWLFSCRIELVLLDSHSSCYSCSSSWRKAAIRHSNFNSRGCKDECIRTKDKATGWSLLVQETRISPVADPFHSLSGTFALLVNFWKGLRASLNLYTLWFANCCRTHLNWLLSSGSG
jgi:hypothetical protein